MRAANAADLFFAGGSYYQVNADGTLTRLATDDQTAVVSPVKIQGIVALGAQGDYVYVSQADKLRILKTSDLSRVAEINLNGSAVFGKNGDDVVIYTGSDQRVTIYDAAGRKKADVALRQEMIPGGIIPAAANRFFVISRDGKARLLDATGRQFWEGQLPAGDRGNFSIYY